MCSKLFTNIVGGFSKLLKFAANDIKKDLNTDNIELYSYVDLAKFNGNGYEKAVSSIYVQQNLLIFM